MLKTIGEQAKLAEIAMHKIDIDTKNRLLKLAGDNLVAQTRDILAANQIDMDKGKASGMSQGLLDRLSLTPERIQAMATGLEKLIKLENPVGEIVKTTKRPNGLLICQKRVPLGVVGIIYEARPNVTTDAFGLCFKTGNVVILKGGSDAINSNKAIVDCIRATLVSQGIDANVVQLIEDTSRQATIEFMKMKQYIDVLIPRGGAGLIQAVVENSTIPVIETGTGNCHIYVDQSADLSMATDIIVNAKTQRIGVCNTCESLLVHEHAKDALLPMVAAALSEYNVELRGDATVCAIIANAKHATEDDWGREYLDYIISIKIVSSVDEAIQHINKYSTKHSESIITSDENCAERFLDEVDSAAVYVNASTRYTDGEEFGFGAEIGISTQKLHARGPMGLEALTTTKFIIYGEGQVRP